MVRCLSCGALLCRSKLLLLLLPVVVVVPLSLPAVAGDGGWCRC